MDELDSLINDTPEITPEVDLSDSSDFSEPEMGELEVDVLEESFFQEPTFSEDDSHPRDPLSEGDALEEGSTFVDSNRDDIDQGYNETIETSSDDALNLRDSDIVIGTDLDRTEHRIDYSSDNMTTEEPYSLQALEEEQSRHETKPEIIRPTDEVRPDAVESNSVYERNGYEYKTDEYGRTSLVTGDLNLVEGERTPLQTEVGHMGVEGDEGGHLIGTRFNGPTDAFNLVPQNANLNRGEWKSMENSWADAVSNGQEVKVMVEPIYGETSTRPENFEVLSQVDGELTYTSFANQSYSEIKGE